MNMILVQSYKGGVGKTTIALMLAKAALLAGRRACVADFDFMGSGMNDLVKLRAQPAAFLEGFFLSSDMAHFDVGPLIGFYRDDQLAGRDVPVILNVGEGPDPSAWTSQAELQAGVETMIANERRWSEIAQGTKMLLDRLQGLGYDLTIIDCHPGLDFISEALHPLAQLNVYVTTLNRGDCFGLIKKINLKKLDAENAFLVLNRADSATRDLVSFQQRMKRDPLKGLEASTIFGNSTYLGVRDEQFAAVPETDRLRDLFLLGTTGLLPELDAGGAEHAFCSKVLARV
jgi:cellulose biosynthesis protein BcsQ